MQSVDKCSHLVPQDSTDCLCFLLINAHNHSFPSYFLEKRNESTKLNKSLILNLILSFAFISFFSLKNKSMSGIMLA